MQQTTLQNATFESVKTSFINAVNNYYKNFKVKLNGNVEVSYFLKVEKRTTLTESNKLGEFYFEELKSTFKSFNDFLQNGVTAFLDDMEVESIEEFETIEQLVEQLFYFYDDDAKELYLAIGEMYNFIIIS